MTFMTLTDLLRRPGSSLQSVTVLTIMSLLVTFRLFLNSSDRSLRKSLGIRELSGHQEGSMRRGISSSLLRSLGHLYAQRYLSSSLGAWDTSMRRGTYSLP